MNKIKILTLAVIVILLQNCQQTEQVTKSTLDVTELANALKSNLDYDKVISLTIDYSNELNSNYNQMSKDEMAHANEIVSNYSSPESLSKNASEEEIKVLLAIVPQKNLREEFMLLVEKLNLKYSYDKKDLVSLIVEKVEMQRTHRNSRVACGGERCEHEAMAAYFTLLGQGVAAGHGADMFMAGVYYHCRQNPCN
jgi:hypothetical protein